MEQKTMPSSSNPKDYTYAVKVEDGEAIVMKEQLDEKSRLCRRLQTQLEIARAEHTAIKERMFLRLDDVYPGVWSMGPEGGVGLRQWQDNLWYVAWGDAQR